MYYAIVNNETNLVENIAAPPKGANIWFAPEGYTVISTETAQIGDSYTDGVFSPDRSLPLK